ncbi:MAG: serine hydrolase, partial [Brevundimonas sp.]
MPLSMNRRAALTGAGLVGTAAVLPFRAWAQEAAASSGLAEAVDAYVRRCLAAFPDQPGLSVAVVKDGADVLTRGYGARRIGGPDDVDERTLFAIASNTKN